MTEVNSKKPKTNKNEAQSFLVPVKSIGRVVDGKVVPSLYHRGGMWFSAVCTGESSFNIISLDSLQTVFCGSLEPGISIETIASKDDETLLFGSNRSIYWYERGDCKWAVESGVQESCLKMLIFEGFFVIVTREGTVQVRSVSDGSLIRTINIRMTSSSIQISHVIHPNTLFNKILIGFSDGHLELWNIKTSTLIHTFNQTFSGSITCICQSPDADILAIGTSDGIIQVMNVKTEECLGTIKCEAGICSIGFRFDSPPGDAQLMCADSNGQIIIWSLTEKARPIGSVSAHLGGISMASFLIGQPIIISYGRSDNCMKEWIVESDGRDFRLLRSREGPQRPITSCSFHGSDVHSEMVVTSGDTAVLALSLTLDTKIHRVKVHIPGSTSGISIPPGFKVNSVSSFATNQLGWDDSVCIVEDQPIARTLNMKKYANGEHSLISSDNQPLSAGKVSPCGHFCVISSLNGLCSVFNMQSGLLKSEFQSEDQKRNMMVSFDGASRLIISLSIAGLLSVFSLKRKCLVYSQKFEFVVRKADYKHETNMLYILCDDYSVRAYDCESKQFVRVLETSEGMVNDFAISPNSKWLLTCSNQAVFLWDLISGIIVGEKKVSSPIRCISVSPDGEFIGTVYSGCNYAELWWFLPLSAILSSSSKLSFSSVLSTGPEDSELLLSLSQGRIAKFSSFINWQKLREQNKPKVPVKKSSKAPFFLSELAAAKVAPTTTSDVHTDEDDSPKQAPAIQQLHMETSESEIREFLLESVPAVVHDEFSLASPELIMRISGMLEVLSTEPHHFDRCLALLSVLVQYHECDAAGSNVGDVLERIASNLQAQWTECKTFLHSSLNAIRFAKGQQQH